MMLPLQPKQSVAEEDVELGAEVVKQITATNIAIHDEEHGAEEDE